jgi:hypothetical protein
LAKKATPAAKVELEQQVQWDYVVPMELVLLVPAAPAEELEQQAQTVTQVVEETQVSKEPPEPQVVIQAVEEV